MPGSPRRQRHWVHELRVRHAEKWLQPLKQMTPAVMRVGVVLMPAHVTYSQLITSSRLATSSASCTTFVPCASFNRPCQLSDLIPDQRHT